MPQNVLFDIAGLKMLLKPHSFCLHCLFFCIHQFCYPFCIVSLYSTALLWSQCVCFFIPLLNVMGTFCGLSFLHWSYSPCQCWIAGLMHWTVKLNVLAFRYNLFLNIIRLTVCSVTKLTSSFHDRNKLVRVNRPEHIIINVCFINI